MLKKWMLLVQEMENLHQELCKQYDDSLHKKELLYWARRPNETISLIEKEFLNDPYPTKIAIERSINLIGMVIQELESEIGIVESEKFYSERNEEFEKFLESASMGFPQP